MNDNNSFLVPITVKLRQRKRVQLHQKELPIQETRMILLFPRTWHFIILQQSENVTLKLLFKINSENLFWETQGYQDLCGHVRTKNVILCWTTGSSLFCMTDHAESCIIQPVIKFIWPGLNQLTNLGFCIFSLALISEAQNPHSALFHTAACILHSTELNRSHNLGGPKVDYNSLCTTPEFPCPTSRSGTCCSDGPDSANCCITSSFLT